MIQANRRYLHSVPSWIEDVDGVGGAGGDARYGCPRRLLPVLDRPINDEPTYTDLLVFGAHACHSPVQYLELGVSVGKNFYVLANALRGARVWGVDRERINPVLERRLQPLGRDGAVAHYRHESNRISYVQGDILAAETWKALAGARFNVVFSDACHQPAALRHEFCMLRAFDLIDPRGYLLVWDDLDAADTGPLTRAFRAIAAEMQAQYGAPDDGVFLLRMNGWLGQHEHRHTVGVINNIGLRRAGLP